MCCNSSEWVSWRNSACLCNCATCSLRSSFSSRSWTICLRNTWFDFAISCHFLYNNLYDRANSSSSLMTSLRLTVGENDSVHWWHPLGWQLAKKTVFVWTSFWSSSEYSSPMIEWNAIGYVAHIPLPLIHHHSMLQKKEIFFFIVLAHSDCICLNQPYSLRWIPLFFKFLSKQRRRFRQVFYFIFFHLEQLSKVLKDPINSSSFMI